MSQPTRILIRLPNWLGDVLLARPLLHAVAAMAPGPELRAVAPAPLLGLLEPEGLFARAEARPREGAGWRSLVARTRAWTPDVALVLPPSFSGAWFAFRCAARRRVGYRHEGRGFLLTDALARPERGERHAAREYLDLGAVIGARERVLPPLAVGAAADAAALDARSSRGLGEGPFAILAPGAIYGPAKRWPTERFAAVGRALLAKGMRVVACGAPDERDLCEALAASLGPGAVSLAGHTDLPVQAALCARAALCVANDSGLAHLAAAVDCPTVVVFGSTSPAWTAPVGRRVRIACRPPVCSPCFQRTCRIGYRCLDAVPAAHVIERAWEVAAA